MTDPARENSDLPIDTEAEEPTVSVDQSPGPYVVDRVLLTAIVIGLIILTVQWIRLTMHRPSPLPWDRGAEFPQLYRVDVNSADWIEWIQLDGIGQKTAHGIVADRELHGPFRSIDDLQRVHGIGPATLDAIRPHLTISHDHEFSRDVTRSGVDTPTSNQ